MHLFLQTKDLSSLQSLPGVCSHFNQLLSFCLVLQHQRPGEEPTVAVFVLLGGRVPCACPDSFVDALRVPVSMSVTPMSGAVRGITAMVGHQGFTNTFLSRHLKGPGSQAHYSTAHLNSFLFGVFNFSILGKK